MDIVLDGVTPNQLREFILLVWRNHGGIDHQYDRVIRSLMIAAGLDPELYPMNRTEGGG